jgi:hypothetical protein
MARNVSSAVSAQLFARQRRPVNAITIHNLSGTTLRYSAAKNNYSFGGQTYIAKAFSYGEVSTSSEGGVGRIEVKLDDTIRDMTGYADAANFEGRKITIWRFFRDISGTTDYETVFTGWAEKPKFDYNWMELPVVAETQISKRFPKRTYGILCDWVFGGTECNKDSLADLTSDSLTTGGLSHRGGVTYLYDTMLKDGTASEWVGGKLFCKIAGTTEERIVIHHWSSASGGTIVYDVPFSLRVSGSTVYELKMGCLKTWANCKGVSPMGATGDNTANYSGWLHIGKKPDKDLGK